MLPNKADQQLDEWQTAIECLMLVAKPGGPTMFARIGILKALNRNVERMFDPTRQDTHRSPSPNGWSETPATAETNPEGRQVARGTISLAFD
jgi:hypothetical protein